MAEIIPFPGSQKELRSNELMPEYDFNIGGEAARVIAESGMLPEEAIHKALGLLLRYRQAEAAGGTVLIRLPGEEDLIPLTFQD